jgi:hypothetical protein
MAKKHAPSPVVYLDPDTGLPTCDPKQCADKLVQYSEVIETNYKWVGGPVKHRFYYSLCSECNKRTITNKDKNLTNESYKRGTENKGVDNELEEKV